MATDTIQTVEKMCETTKYELGLCSYEFFSQYYPSSIFDTFVLEQKYSGKYNTMMITYNFSSEEISIAETDIKNPNPSIKLEIDDIEMTLGIINYESAKRLFDENKNRYLSIDMTYTHGNAYQTGHRTTVIIDTKTKTPYLIDPNGGYTYSSASIENIKKMMDIYFLGFPDCSFNNIIELRTTPFNLAYKNIREYDFGNCVICSRMYQHYIHDHDELDMDDIVELIDMFVTDHKDVKFIYNYTCNIMMMTMSGVKEYTNEKNEKPYKFLTEVFEKELNYDILDITDVYKYVEMLQLDKEEETIFVDHFRKEMFEKFCITDIKPIGVN
jgi:hypothetical protein